jgi:hypothetical protein
VTPSRLTFGEIAEERFEVLESLVAAGERSARTLEAQRRRYNSNLRDTLGNVRVQAITTRHVGTCSRRCGPSGSSGGRPGS